MLRHQTQINFVGLSRRAADTQNRYQQRIAPTVDTGFVIERKNARSDELQAFDFVLNRHTNGLTL